MYTIAQKHYGGEGDMYNFLWLVVLSDIQLQDKFIEEISTKKLKMILFTTTVDLIAVCIKWKVIQSDKNKIIKTNN
jgi:hypothetical protein